MLLPNTYYSVGMGTISTGGANLPAMDFLNPTLNLAAASAKIALVRNAIAITPPNGGNPASTNPDIVDFVGYGATATSFETARIATVGTTTLSYQRKGTPQGATDTDDNSLDFTTGTPLVPHSTPQEINVKQGTATYLTGSSYAFPGTAPGNTATATFTVENLGNAGLGVSAIAFSGPDAADFSVSTALAPASPVAGNNSATFTVSFAPGAAGARTATLTLTNTDSNEGSYTLLLSAPASGVGDLTVSTPGQTISGTYNTVLIANGGTATVAGTLTVNTALTVQSGGTLLANCQSITGAGTFAVAAGGTLGVCDANGLATSGSSGAIQTTGTRSFSPDASYLYNGTVPQNTGPGLPATVRDLTVGNTAGVTLTNDLTTTAALTLTSGVLTTGPRSITLGSTGTLSEQEVSYVLGTVVATRSLAAGAAEPFAGLGLTLTPAAGSPAPGPTRVTRTTGTALSGAGTSQSILRSFDVQPTVNTGLSVTMAFAYFEHERNGIPAANLALFKSVSGGTPWVPQRGTTAGPNVVTKIGIADFSIWTLGNAANPLPVELTAFTATAEGTGAVRLAWATASEKNSARFDVERSTDGRTFASSGTVAAVGSSSTARAYGFDDTRLPIYAAALYYRLKLVDTDGTFRYSPVRTVALVGTTLTGAGAGLTLYPNPAPSGAATLMGAQPGAVVTVVDALGRTMTTATADASGTAALVLPGGLATGVYVVRVGSNALRLAVE
jgi:hypothetical protein